MATSTSMIQIPRSFQRIFIAPGVAGAFEMDGLCACLCRGKEAAVWHPGSSKTAASNSVLLEATSHGWGGGLLNESIAHVPAHRMPHVDHFTMVTLTESWLIKIKHPAEAICKDYSRNLRARVWVHQVYERHLCALGLETHVHDDVTGEEPGPRELDQCSLSTHYNVCLG